MRYLMTVALLMSACGGEPEGLDALVGDSFCAGDFRYTLDSGEYDGGYRYRFEAVKYPVSLEGLDILCATSDLVQTCAMPFHDLPVELVATEAGVAFGDQFWVACD